MRSEWLFLRYLDNANKNDPWAKPLNVFPMHDKTQWPHTTNELAHHMHEYI